MSEKQEVTQKTVGFSWKISVEAEKRIDTGGKYPDKTVTKMSLGGHEDTHIIAEQALQRASGQIKKEIQK